ncbi:hypothetical protein EST38_g12963 [Candolleomyces aberdarensis]|uniref:Uncharacterized protein n=1 Tax=Candolleomyces aberdarensis TaxID=2316362 RepID=A0A4Q2D3F9_9AGAR|nr:hypothetical protein EST38_g12963 [Candolleomyces aberdarensis]
MDIDGGNVYTDALERPMKPLPKELEEIERYLQAGPGHIESLQIDLGFAKTNNQIDDVQRLNATLKVVSTNLANLRRLKGKKLSQASKPQVARTGKRRRHVQGNTEGYGDVGPPPSPGQTGGSGQAKRQRLSSDGHTEIPPQVPAPPPGDNTPPPMPTFPPPGDDTPQVPAPPPVVNTPLAPADPPPVVNTPLAPADPPPVVDAPHIPAPPTIVPSPPPLPPVANTPQVPADPPSVVDSPQIPAPPPTIVASPPPLPPVVNAPQVPTDTPPVVDAPQIPAPPPAVVPSPPPLPPVVNTPQMPSDTPPVVDAPPPAIVTPPQGPAAPPIGNATPPQVPPPLPLPPVVNAVPLPKDNAPPQQPKKSRGKGRAQPAKPRGKSKKAKASKSAGASGPQSGTSVQDPTTIQDPTTMEGMLKLAQDPDSDSGETDDDKAAVRPHYPCNYNKLDAEQKAEVHQEADDDLRQHRTYNVPLSNSTRTWTRRGQPVLTAAGSYSLKLAASIFIITNGRTVCHFHTVYDHRSKLNDVHPKPKSQQKFTGVPFEPIKAPLRHPSYLDRPRVDSQGRPKVPSPTSFNPNFTLARVLEFFPVEKGVRRLHCGCDFDEVLMEFNFWKRIKLVSPTTVTLEGYGKPMKPRDRAYLCATLTDIDLGLDSLYRFDSDHRYIPRVDRLRRVIDGIEKKIKDTKSKDNGEGGSGSTGKARKKVLEYKEISDMEEEPGVDESDSDLEHPVRSPAALAKDRHLFSDTE